MWRLVFAIPLIVHGLAHLSGTFATWSRGDAGFSPRPWIFSSGVALHSALGKVFGLLWLIAALALVSSGLAMLLQQAWWPFLAILAAVLSLSAILPWWNSVPPGAKAGAAFDLLILLAMSQPIQPLIVDMVR